MSSPKLTRRAFLKMTLASALSTTGIGVGGIAYGHEIEPDWIDVNRVELVLPRLTPAFDGYRLVQISDIHMDPRMAGRRFDHVVDLINAQQPDAVAITGDFVTRSVEDFARPLIAGLSRLRARDAAVAVLGNHDHWTNHRIVRDVLRASGIADVSNDAITLTRGDEMLHLGGVDDVWEGHALLWRVERRLPAQGAAILLAHEPDYADISAQSGRFDLQLSGHSHGGQVVLPVIGPPVLPTLGRKYPSGRYQVGNMIQYTNRGVGMVAPAVRFNCRPEITVFTLRVG